MYPCWKSRAYGRTNLLGWILLLFVVHSDPCSESLEAAQCLPLPAGAVSWWTGDGDASDLIGVNEGNLLSGASANAVGLVGGALSFNGTTAYVQVPDSPGLRPTNLTVECWLKFNSLDSSGNAGTGQQYIVFKQNTRTANFEGFALTKERNGGVEQLVFGVSSAAGLVMEARSTSLISTGVWYHVAGVRGANFIQIYVNGQFQSQAAVNFPQDYGTLPLYFGSSGQSYWDRKFSGLLDEVALYNRALSSNEIAAIYLAGPAGKCKSVSIESQPQSLARMVGESAVFSVTASGLAPMAYQWRLNGVPLSGETNLVLNIPGVSLADQGNYTVVISNLLGAVTSAVAVLSVGAPPFIIEHPVSRTNILGSVASFTVVATGSPSPSYQWWFNGAPLAGGTGSSFTISGVQVSHEGNYSVVLSNAIGTLASANASLVVWVPPSIVQQPQSSEVFEGQSASFSVSAVGTAPVSYQWFLNGVAIPGASTSTHTISNVSALHAGDYVAIASNLAGMQTSSVAALIVRPAAPSIEVQPVGGAIVQGESWTFRVGVNGSPPLTYQWLFEGSVIPGATGSAYTIAAAQPAHSGNYAALISNSAGSASSVQVNLQIIPLAIVPDPSLSNALRCALGKSAGWLTVPDLLELTCLSAPNCGVTNLAGLELASNLQNLQLGFNHLTDLTPIGGLHSLRTLSLENNSVNSFIPLVGLSNLTALSLDKNPVANIELIGFLSRLERVSLCGLGITNADFLLPIAGLQELALRENIITDLSFVTNLSRVTGLDLRWNAITNIGPLALAPASLTSLRLGGNKITGLPELSNLAGLSILSLDHNEIEDLSGLAALTNLSYLSVGDNPISDYWQLATLVNLRGLELAGSQVTNLDFISGLYNLQFADLSWNKITDLSPLLGLTNLQSVVLAGGNTVDLAQLPQLPALRNLWLHQSGISNTTFLSQMPAVNYLNVERNQISNVSTLAGLTNLTGLGISYNPLHDLSPLSSLAGLNSLRLEGLCLESVNAGFLWNMPSLRFLDLNYNRLKSISFVANTPRLSSLYVQRNSLGDLAPIVELTDLRFIDVRANALNLAATEEGGPSQILNGSQCRLGSESVGCGELRPAALIETLPQNEPPRFLDVPVRRWFIPCQQSSTMSFRVWDDSFADGESLCPKIMASAASENESVISVLGASFSELDKTVTVTITNHACALAVSNAGLQVSIKDGSGAVAIEVIEVIVVDNTPIWQSCPNVDSVLLESIARDADMPLEQLTPAELLMADTLTAVGPAVSDACVWQWLTNLSTLHLHGASLPDLWFSTNLPGLKVLSLTDTVLPDTSVLALLTRLEHVDFSGTGLTNLDALLPLPTGIKRLDLARNFLRDVSPLSRFPLLSELNLDENRLVNITPLSSFISLSRVRLQQNWVTNITPFVNLPLLRYVDFRTNLVNLAPQMPGGQALFALTNAIRPGGPVIVEFLTQRQPRFDVRTNWVIAPGVPSTVNFELFDIHMDEAGFRADSTNFGVLSQVSAIPRTHTGGTLQVAPVSALSNGFAVVTITASNDVPFGITTNIMVFVTPWHDVSTTIEGGGFDWFVGGEKPWFGQTRISHDGGDAAQSGAVNDLQTSTLETTIVGPGTLSFWWKVSSETNFDFLTLTNNGTSAVPGISGEVGWQLMTVSATPGTNRLIWTYQKDKDTSIGLDAAFIDQVSFVPEPYVVASGLTSNGQFQIGLQGLPGRTYRLEESVDLKFWSVVDSVTFTSQFASYLPTNLVNGVRFYRLRDSASGP